MEATTITPPVPRSTIAGRKARVRVTTASQLTRTISASRSSGVSQKRPRVPNPALLTSRSTSTPSFVDLLLERGGVVGEVALNDVGLGVELLGEGLEAVLPAGDEDQLVTSFGELARELLADARRSSRNQRCFGHAADPIRIEARKL